MIIERAGGRAEEAIEQKFLAEVKRSGERLDFDFRPIKKQGLAAASGTTPFDVLFLLLSMFIIAAALMLVFSPLTIQSPEPSAAASIFSRRLAASEPPRGSVSASAIRASPCVSRCSQGSASSGRACSARICPFSDDSRLM